MSADHVAPDALVAEFPVVVTLPVQWGEMDAYGHVNNTVFFRYFETARIAYLDRCGFLESFDRDRIGAILHSTDCRFRLPLRHPDTVLVGGRAIEVEDDRFTMQYRVISTHQGAVAAEGTGIIVSFNYETGEKTPLPEAIRARIDRMEADAVGRGDH